MSEGSSSSGKIGIPSGWSFPAREVGYFRVAIPGICVAVKATTSYAGLSRKYTLKLWKSRPPAPRMMTLRGPAMDWAAPRAVKPFWGFGSGRPMLTLNKVGLGRIRAFYSWRVLDDPFQRLEDPIKHRSGEAARLRVPLAWVVRSEERDRWERPRRSMAKPRDRRWDFVTPWAPCPHGRAHRQSPGD